MRFPTLENAFQAAKLDDLEVQIREQFLHIGPGDAKRLGRTVKLRKDWESIKLDVMEQMLRQKFKEGTFLARQLIETGLAELIEGGVGDDFWGVDKNGKGFNHLGRLLMKIRAELQAKAAARRNEINEAMNGFC